MSGQLLVTLRQDWREQFFAQPQSLPDWLVANGWQAAPGEAAIRYGVVLTTSPLQKLGRVSGWMRLGWGWYSMV